MTGIIDLSLSQITVMIRNISGVKNFHEYMSAFEKATNVGQKKKRLISMSKVDENCYRAVFSSIQTTLLAQKLIAVQLSPTIQIEVLPMCLQVDEDAWIKWIKE